MAETLAVAAWELTAISLATCSIAEANRAASATDFCMEVDCAMFSAISLSVCSPVLRISSTWALMLPKVLIAALTASPVIATNTQVGQKTSHGDGGGHSLDCSLALVCFSLTGGFCSNAIARIK